MQDEGQERVGETGPWAGLGGPESCWVGLSSRAGSTGEGLRLPGGRGLAKSAEGQFQSLGFVVGGGSQGAAQPYSGRPPAPPSWRLSWEWPDVPRVGRCDGCHRREAAAQPPAGGHSRWGEGSQQQPNARASGRAVGGQRSVDKGAGGRLVRDCRPRVEQSSPRPPPSHTPFRPPQLTRADPEQAQQPAQVCGPSRQPHRRPGEAQPQLCLAEPPGGARLSPPPAGPEQSRTSQPLRHQA